MTFTDGGENSSPYIRDLEEEILEKEAIVHGLLLDSVTDDHDLIKLARNSGGDVCIYEDNGNGGNDYYDCLFELIANLGRFLVIEVSRRLSYISLFR